MRPSIRVEIQNNPQSDAMEVDEEEGELLDDTIDNIATDHFKTKTNESDATIKGASKTGFIAGIELPNDAAKLNERARRFQLPPDEINTFTELHYTQLKASLGVTDKNDAEHRFEAIHMRGIRSLKIEDIATYFLAYAPHTIELIDEDACNVVWRGGDIVSPARALHYLTCRVRGMPVRSALSDYQNDNDDDDTMGGTEEETEEEEGEIGVRVMSKGREIELESDKGETVRMHKTRPKTVASDNTIDTSASDTSKIVDVSEIFGVEIPPGYWRLGEKLPKSVCSLLLRFSLKTDKKPFRVEQLAGYVRNVKRTAQKEDEEQHKQKQPPPIKTGGAQSIFARNKDIKSGGSGGGGTKNPWSALAETWEEDMQFREKERRVVQAEPGLKVKSLTLRKRLGIKRPASEQIDASNEDVVLDPPENQSPLVTAATTESPLSTNTTTLTSNTSVTDQPPEKKKKKTTKFPRMRMYADEEEEKMRRKKLIQTLKKQEENIEKAPADLRRIINSQQYTNEGRNYQPESRRLVQQQPPNENTTDLGVRLKNRNRKMVFAVDQKFTPKNLDAIEQQQPVNEGDFGQDNSRRIRHQIVERQRAGARLGGGMRSDRYIKKSNEGYRNEVEDEEAEYEDNYGGKLTRSKVAVVVRTQKAPTVASTVWSRIGVTNNSAATKEGGKKALNSSSESESNSSANNSSDESGDEEGSALNDDNKNDSENGEVETNQSSLKKFQRPGFQSREKSNSTLLDKKPLRIEITNEHFRN